MTVQQPLTANLTPHPAPVAPLADQGCEGDGLKTQLSNSLKNGYLNRLACYEVNQRGHPDMCRPRLLLGLIFLTDQHFAIMKDCFKTFFCVHVFHMWRTTCSKFQLFGRIAMDCDQPTRAWLHPAFSAKEYRVQQGQQTEKTNRG